jgi:DNA-binding NtrC family response regulator
LIDHFLQKYRFLGPTRSLTVSADFIDALVQVQLPGNARQLENLIRWALVNKDDNTPLNLHDLPIEIWRQLSEQETSPWSVSETTADSEDPWTPAQEMPRQDLPSSLASLLDANGWNLSRSLQHCEKLLLEAALHKTHGNQLQTARLLGITGRSVYNKIHKHQLHC